jgi:hypothetical protein
VGSIVLSIEYHEPKFGRGTERPALQACIWDLTTAKACDDARRRLAVYWCRGAGTLDLTGSRLSVGLPLRTRLSTPHCSSNRSKCSTRYVDDLMISSSFVASLQTSAWHRIWKLLHHCPLMSKRESLAAKRNSNQRRECVCYRLWTQRAAPNGATH